MNEFTTVFLFTDIADFQMQSARWTFIILSIPIVCVLLLLLLNPYPKPPDLIKERAHIRIASLSTTSGQSVLLILAFVWIIITGSLSPKTIHPPDPSFRPLASGNQEYAELQKMYNEHRYLVAEGPVHVIHAQRYEGHEEGDIIRIGNVEFRFSYYSATFGYEQTVSHGGALTEGTYVRVFYVENRYLSYAYLEKYTILRVDVKNK